MEAIHRSRRHQRLRLHHGQLRWLPPASNCC